MGLDPSPWASPFVRDLHGWIHSWICASSLAT